MKPTAAKKTKKPGPPPSRGKRNTVDAIHFEKPGDFRRWLKANHARETEVVALLYKTGSGTPSITWNDGIDEALCFGWIDGVRYPIDDDSYTIRFTPRRKASKWSQVNIDKVTMLREQGRMAPAGEAAFEAKVVGPPRAYSPKEPARGFHPAHEKALAKNKTAKAFWDKLAPSVKHKMQWWIATGKQEATREARMQKLIDACAAGKKLM